MNDYGTVIAPGAIRFQRLLPGPIERVWAFLTEPDKRATWFAGGTMAQEVGAGFELHFRHANLSHPGEQVPTKYRDAQEGVGFAVVVTAYEPPRLLSHTWPAESGEPSEVTFELTPQGESVLLVLTHRRLAANAMPEVASGWHLHLELLADRLNGHTSPPFWATQMRLEQDYVQRIASTETDERRMA